VPVLPQQGEDLQARLARFPVERYPVQHATTQFHLGTSLLNEGDVAGALEALNVACEVFATVGLRLEQAKASNMLGIALRSAGRPDDASSALRAAVEELAALGKPVEQAAASYNLGLVRADLGDRDGAHNAWAEAHRLFLTAGQLPQAAAAAREHGASLLTAGDADAARALLQRAVDLADEAGDVGGLGAASNALGLAHLATGDPMSAVDAFRAALGAYPRPVHPGEYAMVKANLALAHEQAGDVSRARLAARQARAVRAAATPVRAQADDVLARVPAERGDLMTVLDDEPADRWPAVVREEVLRLVDGTARERDAEVRDYLGGVLTRTDAAYGLAEALLHVVLELPPGSYDAMVESVVRGCAGREPDDNERLRAVLGSAMARFAIPQWQRLAASLNAAAAGCGEPASWR
jgi:tetratricopeptide (TPR) repeat protein